MADPIKMTAAGNKFGLSWPSVKDSAQHAVNLLENQGATMLDVVKVIMAGIDAVSTGNYAAIYALLGQATVDVQALIAAFKTEFGLS